MKRKLRMILLGALAVATFAIGLVGCSINNSNHNDKDPLPEVTPESLPIEVGGRGEFVLLNGTCVSWDISDQGVAIVEESFPDRCIVEGVSVGTTFIHAVNEEGGIFAGAEIRVFDKGTSGGQGEDGNLTFGEHHLILVEEQKATCLTWGYFRHYECSHCDKIFDFSEPEREITLNDVRYMSSDHNFVNGRCTVCGLTEHKVDGLYISNNGGYADYYSVIRYSGEETEIVIPDTVMSGNNPDDFKVAPVVAIREGVFQNNETLTSITLPEGMITIEQSAFEGCTNLKTVNLPSTITSIGYGAFKGCTSLTAIYLPSSLRMLGNRMFEGCSKLETVTGGEGLWNIPANDEFDAAFAGTKLEQDFENGDEDYLYIGKCLYKVKSGVTSLEIADGTKGVSNEILTNSDFLADLTSISVPDSIEFFLSDSWSAPNALLQLATSYKGIRYLGNEEHPYVVALNVSDENIASIDLADTTRVIASNAFVNCTATTVNFPNGLVSIGPNAFQYSHIGKAILPDSVIYLGSDAFRMSHITELNTGKGLTYLPISVCDSCLSLKKVTIGENVSRFERLAFQNCSSITDLTYAGGIEQMLKIDYEDEESNPIYASGCNVTGLGSEFVIPENTSRVDAYALAGSRIEKITLPNSLRDVTFLEYLNNLKEVAVKDDNPRFVVREGILFSDDLSQLVCLPQKWEGDLVIPKETLYLHIDGSSSGIKSITVENGNTAFLVEGNCIVNKEGDFKNVMLGCNDSVIPEDADYIDSHAFDNLHLKSVVITEDMQVNNSFLNCTIDSLEIKGDNARSRYFDGSTIITLKAPFSFIGRNDDHVEYTVVNLEITSIGDMGDGNGHDPYLGTLFSNMPTLETVVLCDGFTSINANAFDGDTALKTVTIPASVTQIGEFAFRNCESLTTISGGDNITELTNNAFVGTSLEKVGATDLLYFGKVLYAIGSQVTELNVREGTMQVIYDKTKHDEAGHPITKLVLPASMQNADWNGFYNLDDLIALTDVTVPMSFVGKINWETRQTITALHINAGVLTESFDLCNFYPELTELDLTGVTELESGSLHGFAKLEKLTVPFLGNVMASNIVNLGRLFGQESFGEEEEAAIEVKQRHDNGSVEAKYYIPNSLTSVTVNAGLIGIGAFENCTTLTEVKYAGVTPTGGSLALTAIGNYAFYGCTNLSTFPSLDKVASIGAYAFAKTKIAEFTAPAGLHSIGEGAFQDCTSLKTVTLDIDPAAQSGSESGLTIGLSAFENCTSLQAVTIPYLTSAIGPGVFKGCTSLKSVAFETYEEFVRKMSGGVEIPEMPEGAIVLKWYASNSEHPSGTSDFTEIDVTNATTNATNLTTGEWSTKMLMHSNLSYIPSGPQG